jgi:hypothetical protein
MYFEGSSKLFFISLIAISLHLVIVFKIKISESFSRVLSRFPEFKFFVVDKHSIQVKKLKNEGTIKIQSV